MRIITPTIALVKEPATGKYTLKAWMRPSADDDSIWTGSRFWGSVLGRKGLIEDPYLQIEKNRSWVYICIRYNAYAMSRQHLRLLVGKERPGETFKFTKTRPIGKELMKYYESLPGMQPYLKQAGGGIEEVLDHPYLDMMKKVNPVLNQSDLWMLTETYMGLTGNCYWWKRTNQMGIPYQLWVWPTQKITPVKGNSLDNFVAGYVLQQATVPIPFSADSIVHHKYPNCEDMIVGASPIQSLSDPIIVNEDIYKYERANFKNMARPDGVLSTDEELTDKQFKRIKKEWKQNYSGAERAGQMAILEGGLKYQQIQLSPRELNHLEGRKMTREEIAGGYGVPMALLSPDKVNLANAKIAYSQYMRDTIDPKCRLYEQKINEQLMIDYDDPRIFTAFDPCIPEDRDFALKEMDMHLKHGYSVINELRTRDGLAAHAGWGDRPILPQNMIEFTGFPVVSGQPAPKPPKIAERGNGNVLENEAAEKIAEAIFNKLMR